MADSEISGKASFETIRYAQLWEDADILLMGLASAPGATLVSICSAGDNALAMLTLDPARVVVVDLSAAQVECLKIRIAAYRQLDHAGLLELLGSRPSDRREALFDCVVSTLPSASRAFWSSRRKAVIRHGLAGVGKFERYFRILRRYLLPLSHGRKTVDALFVSRSREERERFLSKRWNNRRWRLLLKVFCSRTALGWIGRDPSFFDHVEGSAADHVARRIVHAAVELNPSENPYLRWILRGMHDSALPLAYREEHFAAIRDRLDRLDIRPVALETFLATGEKADGFNLSDIFEYMSRETFEQVYGRIVAAANKGAHLVYWNMMVPRRMPEMFGSRVSRLTALERRGRAEDKAFFYSDFVVEEMR